MTHHGEAAVAYGVQQVSTLEGRSLDALILLKAASRLQEVLDQWDGIQDIRGLGLLTEALRYNQRLWSIYQVDLASPECPLPLDLRRSLLTLSRFVDRATFQVLAAPDRGRVKALIEINRNLAEGLAAAQKAEPELVPGSLNGSSLEPEGVFDLCY